MKRIQLRKIKQHAVLFLLAVLLLTICAQFISCKKSQAVDTQPVDIYIKVDTLKESEAEFTQTRTIPGGVDNWNLRDNEIYVGGRDEDKREYYFNIVDIDTLAVKRTLHLPVGDMKSPSAFYSPTHFEYLDNRYYVEDQFSKIVVYNPDFKFLFGSMFDQQRYFIDFFKWDKHVMFVIGTKISGIKMYMSEIRLFTLPDRQRPEKIKMLAPLGFTRIRQNDPSKPKYIFDTTIAPSTYGFEKDGKIYFLDPTENVFRYYDLKTKKMTKIELSYLKPKKFTDKQAKQFAHRFRDISDDEKWFKEKYEKEFVYKAYPDNFYSFGLYDLGTGKIGIVGDIDLDNKLKYRLDIIDCKTYRYIESTWFPMGEGFKYTMSALNRGSTKNLHDVDRGLFIWGDREGEDADYITRISRYTLKRIPGTGNKTK